MLRITQITFGSVKYADCHKIFHPGKSTFIANVYYFEKVLSLLKSITEASKQFFDCEEEVFDRFSERLISGSGISIRPD